MKEQDSILTSKVQRATKFFTTGAKVGGNYVKHYAKKLVNPEMDRSELDRNNADDIYESLSQLKGSALKMAQMMSMEKNILPTAYQERFMMAQYSAPPLSYPLVVKTFYTYFGKGPGEIFDTFTKNAVNAASIGQVHQATLQGKKLAVKIQYPGVADSIASDIKMVKPMARRLFGISEADLKLYMGEVEERLLEETDYTLELRRSREIADAFGDMPTLVFPEFYPKYSSKRILVMDWVEGLHMKEFLQTNPSQEVRNELGQALWDFYDRQVHELRQVHADPHPGNFLFRKDEKIGVLDFGCVKVIPEDFYKRYFLMHDPEFVKDDKRLEELLYEMNFLNHNDTDAQKQLFFKIFKEMIDLLGQPFHSEYFDFADHSFFDNIYKLGERISKMKEVRQSRSPRGPQHGLYINRTFFGLYHLLNELGAKVHTGKAGRREVA